MGKEKGVDLRCISTLFFFMLLTNQGKGVIIVLQNLFYFHEGV